MLLPAGEETGYETVSGMDDGSTAFSQSRKLLLVFYLTVEVGWVEWYCFVAGSSKKAIKMISRLKSGMLVTSLQLCVT